MPTNKKEGIIFTTMMCFSMVFGMSIYNLWLHQELYLTKFMIGLLPGFIVAFILDVFVIGVLAKKIAFKLPLNPEKKSTYYLNNFLFNGHWHGYLYVTFWCNNGTRNLG